MGTHLTSNNLGDNMKTTLVIFMAAIAVVHMEPQWPLLQPTVPYMYGTYPAYHQVQVVPRTNPVAPLAYDGISKNKCISTLLDIKFYATCTRLVTCMAMGLTTMTLELQHVTRRGR